MKFSLNLLNFCPIYCCRQEKKYAGVPGGITTYYVKPDYSEKLPEATGDNKYTKNMVPGYTGKCRLIFQK